MSGHGFLFIKYFFSIAVKKHFHSYLVQGLILQPFSAKIDHFAIEPSL